MNETYGPGGFDPNHPNGNVIEDLVDNGDGTASVRTFDKAGKQIATKSVEYTPPPPLPESAPVPPDERLAVLEAKQAAHDKLVEVLAEKGVISGKDVGDIGAAVAGVADVAIEAKP